ncbi:MAG: hypothetical protein DCF32_21640 [Leptolyngbya sp.]|nr:MAG: hypothetical protein DCF32_21640 [Leptolyngbya sp.]
MSSFDWERFLTRWSQETIDAIGRDRDDLPPEVLRSGWLGYPGATEQQITRAEARLGKTLPPSYQAFLRVTNGWRQTPLFTNKLWSIEEIEWFAVKHQAWINAFWEKAEPPPAESSNAKSPNPSIPDAEYFIYGDDQDCSKIRVEYLQTALEISQPGDGAIYLLNPQIVTPDGEWEAWFFGDWLPGADRHRSFQEMMQAEYESFLELRETPVSSATPVVRTAPAVAQVPPTTTAATASLAVITPESAESDRSQPKAQGASTPAMAETWRDLASFTLEFQTRPGEGRLEQRSMVCDRATNAVETRPDMDTAALHQWMLKQLPGRSAPGEAPLGVEIIQLRVLRAAQSEPPMVANPTQPLFLDPIQRGEPFTLEATIQVVEKGVGTAPSLEQRLEPPIVYRAQCVARHLATRLATDLGDITTQFAGGHAATHVAQFPQVRLEQPGLYRLDVWVTPQNISAAPGCFKVPMLLVV